MSRSAERVKGPGPQSVGDNDGDSPALLATTATVRAFPPWPAIDGKVLALCMQVVFHAASVYSLLSSHELGP